MTFNDVFCHKRFVFRAYTNLACVLFLINYNNVCVSCFMLCNIHPTSLHPCACQCATCGFTKELHDEKLRMMQMEKDRIGRFFFFLVTF